MTDITTIVDSYIAVWNETDPRAPARALAQTWTDDAATSTRSWGRGPRRHRRDDRRRPAAVPRPPLRARRRPRRAPRPRPLHLAARRPTAARVAAGVDFARVADDGRLRDVTGFLEAA